MGFPMYFLKVILPALAVAVITFLLIQIITIRTKAIGKKKSLPASSINILNIITRSILIIIAILIIASLFGIKVNTLWAAISAVVVMAAVGFFAGWSLISSFLAAFLIMIWHPYKVGDTIEILPDGIKGKVTEMSMMFTSIKEENNNIVNISNSQILQRVIRRIVS